MRTIAAILLATNALVGCTGSAQAACPAVEEHVDPRGVNGFAPEIAHLVCVGIARFELKDWKQSRADFEAALARTPTSKRWLVRGYLASALAETGDDAEALRAWDEGIVGARAGSHIRPETFFRSQRGVYNGIQGRHVAAIDDFQWLFENLEEPQHKARSALNIMASGLQTRNQAMVERWADTAVDYARKAGDREMEQKALSALGQARDDAGDFAGSTAAYQQEIKVSRSRGSKWDEAEAEEMLGQARFSAGDYRGGEHHSRRAVELFEQAGEKSYADLLRSNLTSKLARFELGYACEDFSAASNFALARQSVMDVPSERRSPNALLCLARAHASKGDQSRARLVLEGLSSKDPSSRAASEARALQQRLTGDNDAQSSSTGPRPPPPPPPPPRE